MLKITSQTDDLSDIKEDITKDTAKALSKTAADAAFAVREELPKKFTLRNGYVKQGIRYRKAYPDRPVAEVYSRDAFMTKQEDGGSFSKSSHRFAIPKGVRSSEKDMIPLRMKPKYAMNQKDVFKADFRGKRHRYAPHARIFLRINNNKNLKALYLLKDRKRYKPRWEFEEEVIKVASKKFNTYFLFKEKYAWLGRDNSMY